MVPTSIRVAIYITLDYFCCSSGIKSFMPPIAFSVNQWAISSQLSTTKVCLKFQSLWLIVTVVLWNFFCSTIIHLITVKCQWWNWKLDEHLEKSLNRMRIGACTTAARSRRFPKWFIQQSIANRSPRSSRKRASSQPETGRHPRLDFFPSCFFITEIYGTC